jgi:hypothetical protein|tara:strand:- start:1985 stop:2248 length:264 start_codon:yes stop_codon:yes gene_type:complete
LCSQTRAVPEPCAEADQQPARDDQGPACVHVERDSLTAGGQPCGRGEDQSRDEKDAPGPVTAIREHHTGEKAAYARDPAVQCHEQNR